MCSSLSDFIRIVGLQASKHTVTTVELTTFYKRFHLYNIYSFKGLFLLRGLPHQFWYTVHISEQTNE